MTRRWTGVALALVLLVGGGAGYYYWRKSRPRPDEPVPLPPDELKRLAVNAELGSFRADRLAPQGSRVVLIGSPSPPEVTVAGELTVPVQGSITFRLERTREGKTYVSWSGSAYYPLDQLTKITMQGSLESCRLWVAPAIERKSLTRLTELLKASGAKPEVIEEVRPPEYVYVNYQRMGEAPVAGVVYLHAGSYVLVSVFQPAKIPPQGQVDRVPFVGVSRTIDILPGKEASFTLEEPPQPGTEPVRFREEFRQPVPRNVVGLNGELDRCEKFSASIAEEFSQFNLDPMKAYLLSLQETLLRNQPERGHLLVHKVPVYLEGRRVEMDLELGHDQVRRLGEWVLRHELGLILESGKGWQERLKGVKTSLDEILKPMTNEERKRSNPAFNALDETWRRHSEVSNELSSRLLNLEYSMRQLVIATNTVADLLFGAEVAGK